VLVVIRMIEIILGNIGSGKTATVVREIVMRRDGKTTFSNIQMPDVAHCIEINKNMIVTEIDDPKNPKKTKEVMNVAFWQDAVKKYGAVNVVIDEAHTVLNARRSMSKQNIIMTEWIALLRRVIGGSSENAGKLVLISQLDRRLDSISREMATRIKFCRCWYEKECQKCGSVFMESNEAPEKLFRCGECDALGLKQKNFIIEVYEFTDIEKYEKFAYWKLKSYYKHYYITDIEKYFSFYDTLQWDNMF
jgi:hypothetical protein